MELLHTLAATIVTLGILVTIHEWGHFYVARRCGVKVLRFSVGFGKAIYSWKDRQGTEYAIAAIPLGGYVKMLDEREEAVPADQLSQAFNRKPVLQRIAIVAAGPLVNLFFAVLAYWFLFVYGVATVAPVVGEVAPGSLAARAGVTPGAEIVQVDGQLTSSWDEVNLRLAARVGESGSLHLQTKDANGYSVRDRSVELQSWSVDVEKESPVTALGLIPWRPEVEAVIGQLVDGERALAAGLRVGDRIETVNDQPIGDWYALVRLVRENPEVPLSLGVQRQAEWLELVLTPAQRADDNGNVFGYIGAAAEPVGWPDEYRRSIQYGFFDALGQALSKTWQMISLTLDSIWKMIEGALSVKNLSGPITIAKVASASAASGLESYISFLAYLSISLGILNLLPIPVLDGGHLLYYAVELVTGKPVSEKIQLLGLKIGMAMLLTLMFVALFNDFMRL
ncbi:sigma E protease regulator RseP [Neptuniibacter halophilus]|uniref:sigma E protease regulator RseP n=1 Tax=Neptuniibacter halophilus TaxID=651666 RepID=UPI0025739992|nr:sigma E protease regulator RseP [Neptuniibacter halophilus]